MECATDCVQSLRRSRGWPRAIRSRVAPEVEPRSPYAAASRCRRASEAARRVSSVAWARSEAVRFCAGDVLPIGTPLDGGTASRQVARCAMPDGGARVRIIRGPHDAMLRPAAFDLLVGSRFVVTPQSNRMGYRLEGPVHSPRARRRHPLRRDADRLAAGAGVGPADPADGRSPDDRRLSEDRDGDHRRSADRRPARAGRLDRVRGVHARRGDRRAQRRKRAACGSAMRVTDFERASARRVRRRRVCGATRRWRRSRRSRSAGRRTGWWTRTASEAVGRRSRLARDAGAAGDGARRRIERAGRRRRRARPRDPRARRRRAAGRRRSRCAPTPASRSTAWSAGRSTAASPGSKRGPARRAPSAARSSATRTSAAG